MGGKPVSPKARHPILKNGFVWFCVAVNAFTLMCNSVQTQHYSVQQRVSLPHTKLQTNAMLLLYSPGKCDFTTAPFWNNSADISGIAQIYTALDQNQAKYFESWQAVLAPSSQGNRDYSNLEVKSQQIHQFCPYKAEMSMCTFVLCQHRRRKQQRVPAILSLFFSPPKGLKK